MRFKLNISLFKLQLQSKKFIIKIESLLMKQSVERFEKLEFTEDEVKQFASFFHLIHHSPGRIRLRASKELKNTLAEFGENKLLEGFEMIKNLPVVKDIKINKIIGSVTIEYDSKSFEPSLWELWLSQKESRAVYERLQEVIKGNVNG